MEYSVPPLESRLLSEQEAPEISRLLISQHLPTEDITEKTLFLVIKDPSGTLIGCCGLEVYPPHGLLRSLAVAPSRQGQGLGMQLVRDTLALAKANHITSLYLLTTTASEFFQKVGFDVISRSETPPGIQQSSEYSLVCPDSATVMTYKIQ